MHTMCAMLEYMNGHLRPHDEAYTAAGRTIGYQALALALGYGATSVGGSRFLQVHTGPTYTSDYGWKSTIWFRVTTVPKLLFNENVHRSFAFKY